MVSREFTGYLLFFSFLYALHPLTDTYISCVFINAHYVKCKIVILLTGADPLHIVITMLNYNLSLHQWI